MNKLTISHTILYSKGWYKRTDIWEDVKKCLQADGYYNPTKEDIIYILLARLQESDKDLNLLRFIHTVSSNIKRYNCDFNVAILKTCLSELYFLGNDIWKIIPPDFSILPKSGHITDEDIKKVFLNNNIKE